MHIKSKVREKKLTKQVQIMMTPADHEHLKRIVRSQGIEVSSFIRLAIHNQLQVLELYIKEKNQTWDIE